MQILKCFRTGTALCAVLCASICAFAADGANGKDKDPAAPAQQEKSPIFLKDRDIIEEFKNPKKKKREKLFSSDKNLRLISQLAARGDVSAMQELAKACESGKGTPRDTKRAFALYKNAAESGYINAMHSLGRCYENGIGTEKDLDKALQWYSKAADKGMSFAYRNAAELYEKKGGEENLKKAFGLFKMGAENYVPSCIYALGRCYENGIGVQKDQAKAAEYMKTAAALGNPKACLYMAKAYEEGRTVQKDEAKAINYYTKAALKGELEAKIFLAPKFENGDGVAKSLPAAFAYYLEGAQAGDPFCQKKAADFYANSSKDTETYRAYFWYKKSFDAGFNEAAHGLGSCYERGIGIQRNLEYAFKYYTIYANTVGGGLAYYELGRCFEKGIGTARLPNEAYKNYLKAANLKCQKAYAPLGECFDKGIGTATDEVEAAKYFKMASDAGDDRGVYNLAIYLYYGKGRIPSNPALAVETLEKHAENNRDAMMRLVEFYSDGIVANRRKAEYWKEKLDRYDELMRKSIDADGAGK